LKKNLKLLIDANVILDVLLDRKDFVNDSSMVWKLCETGMVTGYVSTLTFANIVYIMRKELQPERIEKVYSILKMIFNFEPLYPSDIEKATRLRWKDFEDAIQFVIAERVDANYIVTRNVRDFEMSEISAILPRDLILLISKFS